MFKRFLFSGIALSLIFANASIGADQVSAEARQVVLVVGAAGTEAYGRQFSIWANRWQAAIASAEAEIVLIGQQEEGAESDKALLQAKLGEIANSESPEVWIVLIGHGTFYRDVAKFNLRGLDVSAKELASWVKPIKGRLVVVNCASSSGPFINRLSAPGRTILTATKSGNEQNFARFGDFLSSSIADLSADLDHDDEVSLLEAFLSASGMVAKFYESEGRLATEHALIDDNGDTLGTAATFFRGTRVAKQAKKGKTVDGRFGSRSSLFQSDKALKFSEAQRAGRSKIEASLDALRDQKSQLSEAEYLAKLEPLLIEMAKLYEQVEKANIRQP